MEKDSLPVLPLDECRRIAEKSGQWWYYYNGMVWTCNAVSADRDLVLAENDRPPNWQEAWNGLVNKYSSTFKRRAFKVIDGGKS